MRFNGSKQAFTLIELLIVVAIIGILAAIAVPNFLEAQTRSKASRAAADMRTLATALEAYCVDHNNYPPTVARNSQYALTRAGSANAQSVFYPEVAEAVSSRLIPLTTPIAYVTAVLKDPFVTKFAYNPAAPGGALVPLPLFDSFGYLEARSFAPGGMVIGDNRGAAICSGAAWHMVSSGPDRIYAHGGATTATAAIVRTRGVDYDPTNGTTSIGDIVRVGGGPGPLVPGGALPTYDRVLNKRN